jgi:hypothetical protein
MMFLNPFNPINILARLLVKTTIRLFNWPRVFSLVFSGITSILYTSISSAGFIPTMRSIWAIRRAILIGGSSALTVLENNPYVNRVVISSITPIIKPYLNECVKNANAFSIFHILTMFYYVFVSLTPGLFFLLRFGFGLVLSSLGILWNESLSTIKILKWGGETIISFVEDKFSFSFPRVGTVLDSTSSSSLFAIGLYICIGILGIAGLVVLDVNHPEIIDSLPGLRVGMDTFYVYTVNTWEWFNS